MCGVVLSLFVRNNPFLFPHHHVNGPGITLLVLQNNIIRSNARFTLADPMPRLCPDAVGSANVNGLPTRNRPSRRRGLIGGRTCTTQLRVVINKTLSPYQPGSRTILYDSLVPTDANGHIARHSANVNGVPTRRRMVSSRIADYIGAQSGHRIG